MNKIAIDISFTKTCKMLFFPLLILTLTNSNQTYIFETFSFAQIFNWGVIFSASVICLKYNIKFIILLVLLLFFKILTIALPFAVALYVIAYGLLVAVASSVLFISKGKMIYQQLYYFVLLNVILQLLQITGVWEWPYLFATHGNYEYTKIEPFGLLFMEHYDLDTNIISVLQTRPSGIFSSPTYQSLFIVLALLIHYTNKRKIHFASFFFLLTVILSNSKYPIIALVIIYTVGVIYGRIGHKLLLVRSLLLYIIMMSIYYILFPGLFEVSYNFQSWIYSLYARINNLLFILYPSHHVPTLLNDMLYSGNDYVRFLDPSSITSGYAFIFQYSYMLYVSPILILIVIHHIKKIYSLKKPGFRDSFIFSIISFIIVLTYIMMFNIFSIPLYWVFVGGAIVPRVIVNKWNMNKFH
jgi:hypothetical protein